VSDSFDFEVVTPERKVLSVRAMECVVPGIEGSFGVLPGHAPLLTRLGVGELSYRDASGWHYLSAADGFVEVLQDRVTIIATLCEEAREIDLERAREAKRRAEESMKQVAQLSDQQMLMVELSLRKAITRLQVAGRLVKA
jgi:F-type H+-transporting ATPase subunit epsilon